ncbi:MAG: YiiX/YebB-like N1pC/P60 family cysteine hydrolase [Verrucomicrobiota bacterium]
MKLLPDSKASLLRASVIFLILVAACFYRNLFSLFQLAAYQPAEGDILFQSLPHGELVDAIEGVTLSPWSHCGVVMQVDGRWQVAEAIGYVRHTPLALWILRGRSGHFEAYRPVSSVTLPAQKQLHDSLTTALASRMGRYYDFRYAPDDSEIYCSELVFKAYRDAFGLELGKWEELGQLNWKPFEAFIRTLENGPVPLQRPIITPVGITRSPLLQRIYPKRT